MAQSLPNTHVQSARRSRSDAAPHDPLATYLSELHGCTLLDAKAEVALAERIEALETDAYAALLSYEPAMSVVLPVLEGHMRLPPAVTRLPRAGSRDRPARGVVRGERPRSRTALVQAAASSLRHEDITRQALPGAQAAVRAAFAGRAAARPYLHRVEAARRAHQTAKNELMAANLRLVVSLARRYDTGLLPLADLIQEGNLGLMRAVERFDHRRGFRFSTYAAWWIRHGLTRALSDKGRTVRLPAHLLDDLQALARARSELETKLERPPTDEELAVHTGFSAERLAFVQAHASRKPLSFDAPVGEDGDATLLDVTGEPEPPDLDAALDVQDWARALPGRLSQLSELEAGILRLRFGLDDDREHTLQEVGEIYRLSRERIRQIQVLALDKLRAGIERRPRRAGTVASAA